MIYIIQHFVYLAEIVILAIINREIENVIFRPALDKASRTNGIPNRVFRKIILLIFSHFYKLFNDYINLVYYLYYLKKSITIVLQKSSSKKPCNYTFAKTYRLITLLNTLCKVLKSILAIYINYLIETYALLSNIHIGKKRDQSTKDTLHKIVKKIYLR